MSQKIYPSCHILEIFMPYLKEEKRLMQVLEGVAAKEFYRHVELPTFADKENSRWVRRFLEEVVAHETQISMRHYAQSLLDKLRREPGSKPSRPHSLRKSVLNPDLEALCAWGMLNPDDPDELDLIAYLYHVRGCTQFADLLPKAYRRRVSHYRLTRELVRREYEIEVLEDYVLHGEDIFLRVFSFCRLTGWAHWEDCDQFSHLSYGCGMVPGYSDERALQLCRTLQREVGYIPPHYNPHQPMYLEDVLCEGAYMLSEQLRYGRNFYNAASFVGYLARMEAGALGITEEAVRQRLYRTRGKIRAMLECKEQERS